MTGLFIQLYLDEDVSSVIAKMIRSRGLTAVTTPEAGQMQATDASQLAFAAERGSTLLTHNRVHFEALAVEYFQANRDHAGIIIAVRRPPQEVARRLLPILNDVTADEMRNQLRYI